VALAVRDGTHLVGRHGAGSLAGGVVVVGQPVVIGCQRHRPCNGVVIRPGIGRGAIARRQVVDLGLRHQGIVALRRLVDAARLAVRAEQPRYDSRRHHDVRRTLDGVPRGRLEQGLLLVYDGRVLVRQQPQRRAPRGHCRRQGCTRRVQSSAGAHGQEDRPLPRPEGAHMLSGRAACWLQRQICRRGRRANTGLRASKRPTPPTFMSAKEWSNGTSGRWRIRVCQSPTRAYSSPPATNGRSAAGCVTKSTRPGLLRNMQRSNAALLPKERMNVPNSRSAAGRASYPACAANFWKARRAACAPLATWGWADRKTSLTSGQSAAPTT